jgi:thioredoxin reductase
MSERFSFRFEGREIAAQPGMSLAAALAAAGLHDLRDTRGGGGRGLFCGMGVCQDCLVEVDGAPAMRACMTTARPGMEVRRQAFPGELPQARGGAPPVGIEDIATIAADLVVIGGGAGGLSAATTARRAGLDVLLLDERATPGGQYYKQTAIDLPPLDAQQEEGRALHAAAVAAGVRFIAGAEVWSPLDGLALLASAAGRTFIARGKALVAATGAHERGHVVPGWTLPGAMTIGALQTLWRSYRALAGRRVLIGGNGPLNLQVACELLAGGAEVVAVIEAAPIHALRRTGATLRMALHDRAATLRGLAMLRKARAGGAALRHGAMIRRIEAREGALAVETGPLAGGPGEIWRVDAVGMGYGFQPQNELLRAMGASHDHDVAAGMLRTRRDADGETTVPGLFAVGDCAGLGGAAAAVADGVIAGAAVARRLGARVDEAALAAARRDLARARAFQQALWRLYAAPRAGLALADDDTLVCRCEEVSKREVLAAIGDGAPAIGEVKRRTRCGMGRCQGRYCGPPIVEELARRAGRAPGERDFFAPRGPVKPVRIADLVGGGSGEAP